MLDLFWLAKARYAHYANGQEIREGQPTGDPHDRQDVVCLISGRLFRPPCEPVEGDEESILRCLVHDTALWGAGYYVDAENTGEDRHLRPRMRKFVSAQDAARGLPKTASETEVLNAATRAEYDRKKRELEAQLEQLGARP